MVVVVLGADKEVFEDGEMALWYNATTAKSWAIQSTSVPSEREASERYTCLCHSSR